MKKNNNHNSRSKLTVLHQLCNLIPPFLVERLGRELGMQPQARSYSLWSHVVTLLFVQVARSFSLNDVCDALKLQASKLAGIRGATPPSRNNLSYASKHRSSELAQRLFWNVLQELSQREVGFGCGRGFGPARRARAWRFKRPIHAIDSSVIKLVLSCMDWAKHRRRKAAAKLHLRFEVHSQLPRFAVVNTAKEHDSRRAAALCAGIRAGEIAVFDRAYRDLCHLRELTQRGVFWVTRTLTQQDFRVVKRRLKKSVDNILRDDEIRLAGPKSKELYPEKLRRVVAWVEVDGQLVEMEFLTNNFEWAPSSVAELYRCRWEIEVFFRQLKQTLQVCDFLGNSLNAVQWQLWMALLVYVLLKYLAYLSRWSQSFIRLWAIGRAILWERWDLMQILHCYGTAGPRFRLRAQPEQAFFPYYSLLTVG